MDGATAGSVKSSSNLARWSVSPTGQSSAQTFEPGRTDLAPVEDCQPDPKSGKPADRATGSDTPARRHVNDGPSFAAHSKAVTMPIGPKPDVEDPLAPEFLHKQSTTFDDSSLTKVKIPKARSQKKRAVPDDPSSPRLQDSIETGTSID
jgi:hypothetical protein